MKTFGLTWALLAACLMVAGIAPSMAFAEGLYGGIGLGLSRVKPDTKETGYSVDDSHSNGFKVYLGYEIDDRFSVEGYFSDLGEAKIAPNGYVEYQDFGVSGMYYFYRQQQNREGFSAFVRAGLGNMENDSDIDYSRQNDLHLLLGVGGEYALGNGFAVRGDLDFYDEDARMLTLSVLKRFQQ